MTDITEANVDFVIQEAIEQYFAKGMLVDAMVWQHCIGLLQKKYHFTLERVEK